MWHPPFLSNKYMNYRLTYVSGFAASQLLLVMLRNQLFDAGYGSLRACPQCPHQVGAKSSFLSS